jgi:hypothetical protein
MQPDFNTKEAKMCLDRVARGDQWGWCVVTVTVSWQWKQVWRSLGGCSYKDETDFRDHSGYFSDMVDECLADLNDQLQMNFNQLIPLIRN